MIFSHLNQEWIDTHVGINNGAYWYSKEIYENILPKIKTDRNWILINVNNCCADHSIVFIHNNAHPESYWWLDNYDDLILVCSQVKTLKAMIEMFPRFHSVLLPLSIDTKYVKKFKVKQKTKEIGYYGRKVKCPPSIMINDKIEKIYSKDREYCLKEVAKFKTVYAIGRCALEAKCLGCEVLSHEGEYVNTKFDLLDNKEVIPMLQRFITEIDQL